MKIFGIIIAGLLLTAFSGSVLTAQVDRDGISVHYSDDRGQDIHVGTYKDYRALASVEGFGAIHQPEAFAFPSEKLEMLKGALEKSERVMLFVGNWCEDSQTYAPEIIRALIEAGYNMDKVTIVALDENKKGTENIEEKYDVSFVPTAVFYSSEGEIGRFVEMPDHTVLDDLIRILNADKQ